MSGCEKDNYDAPSAKVTGQIMYQGKPVQVANGRIQLELWQTGFNRPTKIPVYTNQEGNFSADVFNGTYKMVLLRGVGPWVPNSDTITVNLNGSANVDVPVTPYYIINNPQITKGSTSVTGTATIQNVANSNKIEYMAIYLSSTALVDVRNQLANARINAADLKPLTEVQTVSVNIPTSLNGKEVYARIGVKTAGVEELIYSPVVKL